MAETVDRATAELLSDQFASLDDARPVNPRVVRRDDELRFDFDWPLAPWEELVREHGQDEMVHGFRVEFLRAISPSLAELVEFACKLTVSGTRFQLEQGDRHAAFSFELGAEFADDGERELSLRNWGGQVRRNARRQRSENRRRLEEVRRSAELVRRTRAKGPVSRRPPDG